MSLERKINKQRIRRALRVRRAIKASGAVRISVFRSAKHMFVQVINDEQQVTLASYSTLDLKQKNGDKKDQAKAVGLELAKKVLEKGITSLAFDRGRYLYHGRVAALAEGLREGGLEI